MKDVHTRVMPYYEENIKKDLESGKNVLIVAHGNTLRALAKHLEDLDEVQVCDVEFETGAVHCYHFDDSAKLVRKETKKAV